MADVDVKLCGDAANGTGSPGTHLHTVIMQLLLLPLSPPTVQACREDVPLAKQGFRTRVEGPRYHWCRPVDGASFVQAML